jgi:MYXO-CTERM domain-containing protein
MRLQIALACVAGLAFSASAQIRTNNAGLNGGGVPPPGNDATLWDQSAFDGGLAAIVDQDFGDFPSFSTFMVDDFTTGGQAWNVDSVTTYFTNGTGLWAGNVTQAKLQVYSKSGNLPSNGDVPPEYKVNVTVSDGGGYLIVNADTSGIAELQGINGDFWIGLTPTADFGVFGQEFHLQMLPGFHGDIAAVRNPGGGFGIGTNWVGIDALGNGRSEMAFRLDGTVVPAPGAFALLGLGGLAAARRRRA